MKTADYIVHQRKLVLYALLLGSLLSLGGCVSRVLPPSPLSEDKFIDVKSNVEKNTNSIRTQKIVAKSGSNLPEEPKGLDSYAGFNAALIMANDALKKSNLNDSNANADLLIAGMNLIKGNCSHYFTNLGKIGQNTSFARRETNLLGTSTAALMGMFDATSKAISATATGFGFTTSTIDTFSDVYLFSPEIKNVQDLVIDALKIQMDDGNKIAKAAKLNPINDPLTYTEVIQLLFQMESTCQPHGIHQLINTAVANNKVVPKFEESSVEKLQLDISEFEAKATAAKTKLRLLNPKIESNDNFIETTGDTASQLDSISNNLKNAKDKAEKQKNEFDQQIKSFENTIAELEKQSPKQEDQIPYLKEALKIIQSNSESSEATISTSNRKINTFDDLKKKYQNLDNFAKDAEAEFTKSAKKIKELEKQPESSDSTELSAAKKKADESKQKAKELRKLADDFAENLIKPYRQEMKKSGSTLNRSLGYEVRAKN